MYKTVKENWMLCSEMRQEKQRRQDVSGRRRYLLGSNGTASQLVMLWVQ